MLRVRWVVLAALAAGCSERSSTTQLLQRQSFPTVTSFSPSGGLAGTSVTVIGSGFTGATYVSFANKPASFTIDSDTQLHATVPSGAISGPIGVSTAGGSQSPQSFTVFSSATPTITGISPSSGPAGNFVTINGTGFTGLTSINFNGASTAFTGNPGDQMTDTTVQQQVPAGAMTGPITITNTLGTSNASATFTVSPTPSPTGFMPARAAAGAPVTVTGTNLAGVTGVSVGNVAASISTVGASQISFTVPANAVSAAIYLSVGSGRYSPPGVLKVTASQAPAITSLSPPATAVGQMVNIHGSGFAGVTSVTVNGAAAAFDDSSFFDATQLFVTVPAGATTGKISITNSLGTATSSTNFVIDPNALQVTSVSPSAGPIGTSVTLTGHGFSQVQKVSWGGGASSGFTLVSDTQITTAVPAGQPDGQQAILLQTASGATAIALFFVGSAPAVTGFSPASAFIGQPVTISGSSLTGATAVKFNGTAASFSVVSDAQVSATVPFGASSGAISVTTPLGTASSASSFTVLVPAPTVASVVPSSGPTAGGGPITITGNFFQNGATVTLGGTAASSLSVVNPQTITAVAPAHAAGAVAVVVTNPDTQSGTLAAGYTYVPPPQPSAIAPQAGTANGGTSVTVSGSGFVAGATLSIGGSAAQVASVTATSITATTGPHAAGVVDVVVKNPDGQTGTLPSAFSYNAAPKPILSMAQPSTGSSNGGTSVTLSGASFAPGATVAFGGTPAANVTFGDPTSLVAVTPPHAVGAVDVTLVNPDGQMAVLKGGFTFVPGAAPLLSSVAPAMGPSNGGTTLTLGGMNFAGGATVTVGGVAAQIGSVTATSIIAKTGAHAAGTADVVVTNPDGQSSTKTAAFTYVADPAPAVTSIAPAFGPGTGGTSITVGGTNFVAGATITIGASAASSVAFVDAMTLTGVTGASTPGQADVIVTNPDGQTGTLKAGWIYTQAPPPTLTSVTPAAGLSTGGTNVTLAGKHLVSGATVSFGGAAASNVVVAADGLSLTATTAAHASGVVDVTLVNPDGQMVTLTGGFTYTPAPAPTVSAIAPANGPAAGGTMVSITGDHFVAGAAVAIGGAAATSVNVVSPTSIVAVTAANSPGAVDVVVTNPDGQKGTLAGGFTYDAPPDMAQPLDMTQTPPDLSGGDMADGGVTPPPDLATPLDFSTPSPSPDLSTPSPSPDLAMPPNPPAPDMAMAPSSGGGCDAAGGSPGFGLLAAALVAALLLRKRKILPPSRR